MITPVALGWLARLAIPFLSVAVPSTYGCHLHPLARLSQTVEEGMPVQTVLARFEAYADQTDPDAGGVAVLGDLRPRSGRASRILFVQDLWKDEDLILTAWFDQSGTARSVDYRCGEMASRAPG
jgi:hypothetical protein